MKKYPIIAVSIPIVLAVISGCIVKNLGISSVSFNRFEFLLNSIITSATTIAGFVLAAVTILVGAANSAIMKTIKNEGGLEELRWRYIETLILALAVVVIFTILGGVVEPENNSVPLSWLSLCAGILVAYLSSTISTCYYLLAIIGKLYDDDSDAGANPSSPEGHFRIGSQ